MATAGEGEQQQALPPARINPDAVGRKVKGVVFDMVR